MLQKHLTRSLAKFGLKTAASRPNAIPARWQWQNGIFEVVARRTSYGCTFDSQTAVAYPIAGWQWKCDVMKQAALWVLLCSLHTGGRNPLRQPAPFQIKGTGVDQMVLLINIILNGLLLGGIYAVTAVGRACSTEWRILNIAHGEYIMVGAFLTWLVHKIRCKSSPRPGSGRPGHVYSRVSGTDISIQEAKGKNAYTGRI